MASAAPSGRRRAASRAVPIGTRFASLELILLMASSARRDRSPSGSFAATRRSASTFAPIDTRPWLAFSRTR